ncbi:MAG: cytochrome C oxidase subunit IV family protein, partial [Gemmataceae bacterium]|nr:cytochrome C oxidase subunit IV family protein [Gemmataceae bacterium]
FTLPLQLAIGSVQAGLVAYYFMHLKQGDKVVVLTALSALFWMFIMFVLVFSDYMTRTMIVNN